MHVSKTMLCLLCDVFVTCRNAEANAMSLTMLLRRSPDLDVETLGQMNLVSSSSLKGPEEPQANAKQPAEHVVSNDNNTHTDVLDRHHLHSKPAPRPRHAVVPHAIHLTDLAPVPWHDGMHLAETANSDAESEHSKAQPPPLWQSALHAAHGSSPAAVAANGSKGSQQAAVAASGKKKAYVHMCRWYPHINARDAQAAFDLYHPSAKVSVECSKQSSLQREVVSSSNPTPTASTNEQSQAISNADLPAQTAGLGVDEAEVDDMAALHSRSGAASTSQSVAASTGESVVQSTQDSDLQNHDQSCLHLAGASAVQSTDDSAVSAAGAAAAVVAAASAAEVAASDPQGSYSVQEPSLDADPLSPHKNGSVRFQVLLDSITSSEVTNSAAASSEPGVLMSNMPAVAVDDNNPGEQVALGGKGKHFMRTVSSVSASSMKSSLKSVLSNGSSASLRHGSVQLGVNFAETEEDADIKDIEEGKTSIVRGVSDAFPAWLTEGYVLFTHVPLQTGRYVLSCAPQYNNYMAAL